MTMRKFEDLWCLHIPQLIPDKSRRPEEGKVLVKESHDRNLRKTSNQLIAHYADENGWILTPSEVETLIRSNGWETEEEVVNWVGPVIGKMLKVEAKIRQQYEIPGGPSGDEK